MQLPFSAFHTPILQITNPSQPSSLYCSIINWTNYRSIVIAPHLQRRDKDLKEDFSPLQFFSSSLELFFFSVSSDPSHDSKDVSPASLNEHLLANLQSTQKERPQKDRPKCFNPSCSTTDVCTCAHLLRSARSSSVLLNKLWTLCY